MNEHQKILIVEDDNATARLIQLMLEKLGYSTAGVFSSGEEAIEKISDMSFSLVLMDIMLKGEMNGISLAEWIRECFDVPVVFLSAYEDEDLLQGVKKTRLFGYILKPFNISDIKISIEIALYQHQMNQRLRESEETYRQLMEHSPDAVVLTDLQGNIEMFNNQMLALSDFNKEIIGKNISEYVEPKNKQFLDSVLQKTLELGIVRNIENKLVRKDHSTCPVEFSFSLIRDINGNAKAFLGVIRDITKRREMEKQLFLKERLAGVGQLAAGLAHNLRNPLSIISSTAQYCLEDLEINGQSKEALEVIKRNADSAGGMIYELLNFAGPKEMDIKPDSLYSSLNKVHRMMEPDLTPHGIRFIKEIKQKGIRAIYDADSIIKVLINIYLNSIQSIKRTGFIRTGISASDSYAIIKIEDNGCGIPQENLAKIFDPFFSTKEKGTGLGLSICHRSLESQNGSIIVESKLNQGTIVTVRLPREPNATK